MGEKCKNEESFDERKNSIPNPLKGRPRTAFGSVGGRTRLPSSAGGLFKKAVSKSSKGEALSQRENYDILDELRCLHGITRLLTVAGIPRSSYYKWQATQPQRDARQDRDREIKEHMMAIHFTNREFGYTRMTTALWEAGLNVNHKKVWRMMRELSIQSVIRRKRKKSYYTPSVIYPNRLKRKFHATAPQQKMVTDITYISDGSTFVYLSVIQDLFNNEIVAWRLSQRNDVQLVLDTVEQWTKKETFRKPYSIQTRASSIRLRRTTHD